jgi:hypothetical protein
VRRKGDGLYVLLLSLWGGTALLGCLIAKLIRWWRA